LSGVAANLNFSDAQFDLVLQSTLFTSVLDLQIKKQIATEMRRVVKPDGLILWYDCHMNNPRNTDVEGVKKREIYELFSGCSIEPECITLAPPINRLIAQYSWFFYYWLCAQLHRCDSGRRIGRRKRTSC
jgi:ubiquinone/menaquinone biosynthesis C-methylase UbiE